MPGALCRAIRHLRHVNVSQRELLCSSLHYALYRSFRIVDRLWGCLLRLLQRKECHRGPPHYERLLRCREALTLCNHISYPYI